MLELKLYQMKEATKDNINSIEVLKNNKKKSFIELSFK